jgi:3-deoxy-manno-octulosonate cytidylyltransferase (CMP-KDO synthetase)
MLSKAKVPDRNASGGGSVSQWSIVIPARLGSQRFPHKVLAEVDGRSLLEHIWHTATQVLDAELVTVLTDTDEVINHVHGFGGRVHRTSREARNGTERAAEHLAVHDATAVMNVQGDDPFVTPAVLHAAMAAHDADERSTVTTPIFPLEADASLSPHVVKVAHSADGSALYFSRAPIPVFRDDTPGPQERWGHVGLYCYARTTLERYGTLPEGSLERAEQLEQLRFLEHGIPVRTFVTDYVPSAIDVPEDLARVLGRRRTGRPE